MKRRDFLKTGAAVGTTGLFGSVVVPQVHAAGSDMIKVALVGCGGRGSGAIRNVLSADRGTKLWAVADAFSDRAHASVNALKEVVSEQVDVEDHRVFVGLDAYKNAIDSLDSCDLVILATPEVFRPLHYEYAVNKGVNIFAEKAVGVDVPGLKRIRAANKTALEKNLKVAVGLNNRHYPQTRETVEAIHSGRIGDVVACWVYRSHSPNGSRALGNNTPLQHQLRSNFHFDWTSGGWFVGALVHNIDICCWAKKEWPVDAQGIGGRISRTINDQLMEIGSVQFTFGNGTKMVVHTRNMINVWHTFQANIQGTNGSAQVGEGIKSPKIYKGFDPVGPHREVVWEPKSPVKNSYQEEQECLLNAIRKGDRYNEMEYGIQSTFFAVMARTVVQTGAFLTTEKMWTSTFQYVPDIDHLDINGDAPAMPDKDGHYFIPIPGVFKFS